MTHPEISESFTENGQNILVHRAPFPILPYFSQSIAPKVQTIQKGQGDGHSSKNMKLLFHIFSSIGSPKSGHDDPSFVVFWSLGEGNISGFFFQFLLINEGRIILKRTYKHEPPINTINMKLRYLTSIRITPNNSLRRSQVFYARSARQPKSDSTSS